MEKIQLNRWHRLSCPTYWLNLGPKNGYLAKLLSVLGIDLKVPIPDNITIQFHVHASEHAIERPQKNILLNRQQRGFALDVYFDTLTHPKFNIEPENGFQKQISFSNMSIFRWTMLNR